MSPCSCGKVDRKTKLQDRLIPPTKLTEDCMVSWRFLLNPPRSTSCNWNWESTRSKTSWGRHSVVSEWRSPHQLSPAASFSWRCSSWLLYFWLWSGVVPWTIFMEMKVELMPEEGMIMVIWCWRWERSTTGLIFLERWFFWSQDKIVLDFSSPVPDSPSSAVTKIEIYILSFKVRYQEFRTGNLRQSVCLYLKLKLWELDSI